MAYLVDGDRETFDIMLTGGPSLQLRQYLEQTQQYFHQQLTDVGRQFANHAQNVFARMGFDEAYSAARAALHLVNAQLQQDIIYTMNTIEELQEAPPSMVRWIMCEPELREMYYQNRIEAYGDRYIDTQPDKSVGWLHQDYQMVYNGWIMPEVRQIENEDGSVSEVAYDVMNEILFDENDIVFTGTLLDEEAASIISTHNLVRQCLFQKRDPTSYYDRDIV